MMVQFDFSKRGRDLFWLKLNRKKDNEYKREEFKIRRLIEMSRKKYGPVMV
ncbi:hypothetical protein ACFL2R_02355 [Patescibacteria group bacterium]